MNPSQGLVTSLNAIREASVSEGTIYHQYLPIVDENTDIGSFGTPILTNTPVMNEFMSRLINRIVYTSFENRYFNNPLQVLEGDRIPLGYSGQEIYVNPAKGRKYDVNDFAGLLVKYEADVKVQYTAVNMDLQYPVTVSRHKLKQAFVSWDSLDNFVMELSNSLYNGAYIGEFNYTKGLVSAAFKSNQVQYETISAISSEATAKAFVQKARELFLNFQLPSTAYNAWSKVGGYGKEILTYTKPEDIVFLVRNDIRAYLDVNVLAESFNMDRATLLGNIIPVDNFDQYDDDGVKIYDGSAIVGMIADKSWFRIKRQDMYMDEFYNPNNRTWQYYLNLTKMYNYSLFANGVVFCTSAPSVDIVSMKFTESAGAKVTVGDDIELHIETTPFPANATITYSSGTVANATVAAKTGNNKIAVVTGVKAGSSVITATAGNVTATYTITVEAAS